MTTIDPAGPTASAPGTSESAVSSGALPDAPPDAVEHSYQLWVIALVVGLVGAIVRITLAIVFAPEISASIEASVFQPSVVPGALALGVVVFAVLDIVVTVVLLGFAMKMRAGRNWARTTLTVLGILGLVHALSTSFDITTIYRAGGVVASVVSLIFGALVVVAMIFAYQPSANAWFRGRREAVSAR